MSNFKSIIYSNSPEQFPNNQPVIPLRFDHTPINKRVSLVATTKNEQKSVLPWFESIYTGDLLPDEIIIVDGGSTDNTLDILTNQSSTSPVPIIITSIMDANIAQGRNVAINQATCPIISVTDFGCRPKKDWLKKLIFPFCDNSDIDVVAGWYQAVDRHRKILQLRRWPSLDQIDPQKFIPSSRSIAFKKTAWEAIGGYPEWLTNTGEDTLFAMELRNVTKLWAFVPEAVVEWNAPDTMTDYWKKQYYWSFGDGEAGINTNYYGKLTIQLVLILVILLIAFILLVVITYPINLFIAGIILLSITISISIIFVKQRKDGYSYKNTFWEVGAKISQNLGYLRGLLNRKSAMKRRLEMLK